MTTNKKVPKGYQITGLVRRQSHAEGITSSGAAPVLGDLNNSSLISHHVQQSGIIFHTATADHLPSVLAVLDGIKAGAQEGKETIFIHTSGTSVLEDRAMGAFKSNKIYHDNDPIEIDSAADSAPNREIDLAIIKARKELEGRRRS
ncbi:uncharacterized protein PAC_07632 [Phialocephala subalpina]|uniref:NmrA-like domain-containing protein n=1 Tax=Phialocephala subalpina TaxID=576137 RepID=A0A1L7WY97_9HELO|nr:uncharacterized protein PAC_07632 [Phialocephala subalpina]